MGTPDSVKIRRMKFEIEIESPSSRQRRARSASTSVGDSPSKLSSGKTSRREFPLFYLSLCADIQDIYLPLLLLDDESRPHLL
jgi:hypothetical protein